MEIQYISNIKLNKDKYKGRWVIRINRKQRRQLDRKGFDGDKVASIIDTYKTISDAEDDWVKDGEKVKLDVENIKQGKDWDGDKLTEKYKVFVIDNADTIFTVKFEDKYGNMPSLVTFEEDDTWLFWVGDLIRLKEKK